MIRVEYYNRGNGEEEYAQKKCTRYLICNIANDNSLEQKKLASTLILSVNEFQTKKRNACRLL